MIPDILTETHVPGLPGNPAALQPGIGFERISRAARIILLRELNDAIGRQEEIWREADLEAQQLGLDPAVGQVDIPRVPTANFFEGPKKTMLEAPIERFPNVSMMAYGATRSQAQFFDQAESSDVRLFVECMAVSGPVPEGLEFEHETIVLRRIERMGEAVQDVLRSNTNLLGTVHDMQLPPQGGPADNTWLKREHQGAGVRYVWQGYRLVYTLQRHHL